MIDCVNASKCKQSVHGDASVSEQWGLSDSAIWRLLEECQASIRSTDRCYTCFSTGQPHHDDRLWCQRSWASWLISGMFVWCTYKSAPFFLHGEIVTDRMSVIFLQEIQDHRQFVDFSSYNNRPAVHLILFVHSCGHSDNFSSLLWALWGRCAVQSDCSDRWSSTCSSLSGLFTLSVRTMQVGRWRLSITISCCLSDFSSSIWDFSSEFNISNRSDS